jgi:glycosyltransferase involved in cell wall biosynthesis
VSGALLRVAFTFSGGSSYWTGGLNYLRNTFRVLRLYAKSEIHPVLFVAPETSSEDVGVLARELAEPPVRADWLTRSMRGSRFRQSIVVGVDRSAAAAFAAERIDVVFEAGEYFGRIFPWPALTWVADFQSHHLPRYFSWRARWRTYLGRRLQLLGRRLILLSSEDAQGDCHRFYPSSHGATVVVRFAIARSSALSVDETVDPRYDLPSRFIYLPNQYWKHKNHQVVIQAVAALSSRAPGVIVVSSGSSADHRDPGHFERLRGLARELGVERRYRYIGLVPHEDVLQLALKSVAVINPSFVEGWSTTVEESKSLGVPLLLSSIAVHHEQAGNAAIFFDPHSVESCADALATVWERPQTPPVERLQAASASAERQAGEFGRELSKALHRAAALGRAKLE